jgi:flagellar assembly factor FliW
LLIESTRFGEVEVADDAVLSFPDGLIGLPGTRYALLANSPDSPFYWLHSVEHPEIAVPVTTPWLFFSDYEVGIPDEDTRRLELDDPTQTDIFVIVRAASELESFTANLAAPVVLHTERRLGRQIMNDTRGYAVRHPLFSEVELSDVQASTPRVPVAAEAV